jgi:hypothetical protein
MKQTMIGILAGGVMLLAGAAQAAPATFDKLDAGAKLSSINKYPLYAGLSWSNSWYLGDTAVTGYASAAHSGTRFVTNGFGVNNLAISSADPFDFDGAWFATPGTNGAKASWINISAFDSDNRLIGSTGNFAIGADYRFAAAHFSDVSRLVVTRDTGWFVMDDLAVTQAREVPAPGSGALTGLGFVLLAGVLRRRQGVRPDLACGGGA